MLSIVSMTIISEGQLGQRGQLTVYSLICTVERGVLLLNKLIYPSRRNNYQSPKLKNF